MPTPTPFAPDPACPGCGRPVAANELAAYRGRCEDCHLGSSVLPDNRGRTATDRAKAKVGYLRRAAGQRKSVQ